MKAYTAPSTTWTQANETAFCHTFPLSAGSLSASQRTKGAIDGPRAEHPRTRWVYVLFTVIASHLTKRRHRLFRVLDSRNSLIPDPCPLEDCSHGGWLVLTRPWQMHAHSPKPPERYLDLWLSERDFLPV